MKLTSYEPRYHGELLAFLGRVFAAYPHKSEPEYFDWMFGGNPLGPSLATYQLLLEGDRVVGQMGTIRARLRVGGEWVDSLSVVDLIIDPAFRGGLAARQLFKRAMASARLVFATGVAAHVVPIYNGLGWRRLTPSRSCYGVFRPSRLLALAGTTEGAPKLSGPVRRALGVADRVLPLARRAGALAHRRTAALADIEEVKRFEPSWDAELSALLDQCGITEFRSAALLNWKFVDRPIGRHRILVLRASDGALRGMLVLKWMTRPTVARWLEVADYLVAPSDVDGFRGLARASLMIADEGDLDFVRFRLSHPAHVRLLRRPVWVDYTRPYNDDIFAYSCELGLLATMESSPWHLTALASDRSETGRDEWPR